MTTLRYVDVGTGTIIPLRLPDFPSVVSLHASNPGVYYAMDPVTLQTRECKFADALEIDHSTPPQMDPEGVSYYGARAPVTNSEPFLTALSGGAVPTSLFCRWAQPRRKM